MIVLEDCARCGEVATEVPDADVARWEDYCYGPRGFGVRPASVRWHACPRRAEPIRLSWWEKVLRWFR